MSKVNSSIHIHNTRQKYLIHQLGHNFTATIAGPLLWRALSNDFSTLPSINMF